MSLFPSLPAEAHLSDVFKRFPKGLRPLLELHDALLRDDGALTIAQRELIAAYVSGLNGCDFCYGAHTLMAQAFGVDPALLEALITDLDAAPVDDRLKTLLRYLGHLTRTPSRIPRPAIDEVRAAGWSEEALYEAVSVCALYSYMNRIAEAAGLTPGLEYQNPDDSALKQRRGSTYVQWGERTGILPPSP